MPPRLSLNLVDVIELREGEAGSDEVLTRLPVGKGAELLALLAYRPKGVPRPEAAGLLWPDAPESVARHRLRTLLLEFGGRYSQWLGVTRDRVGLAPSVEVSLDDPGTFAPGIETEWIEEARADLTYRIASRLVLRAQERATDDPLAAIQLAEEAQRLVPESLAAEALLRRLRTLPRSSDLESAPFLSLRDRARLAVARAPMACASGDLQGPAREIDGLLAALPTDPPLRAALLVARAAFAYEAGEYPACRRYAEAALAGGPDVLAGPAERAWAHLWIARLAYSSGDFSGSASGARRAARLAREAHEPNVAVLADCLSGAVEILRGRLPRVDEHLAAAREIAGDDVYLRARCDNVTGWRDLGAGASARALRAFEAARGAGTADRRFAANVLQGLACAHDLAGDRESARLRLGEGIALLEGTDLDMMLVGLLAVLAVLEEADGRFAVAMEHHQRCLARQTGAGDRLGSFTSLAGIGRLSLKLGEPEGAVPSLREAYALHTALLGEVRLPIAALPLAEALLACGRRREATGLVARSIEILEAEPPEVRAGNGYPAEIPELAKRLMDQLAG